MLGVGLTMEGIENNPVMYELLCELPWRPEHFSKDEWLQGYLRARYGRIAPKVLQAWRLLARSIYECPAASTQQGTHESIFCARPSLNTYQASSWSEMSDYYDPADVILAADLMVQAAPDLPDVITLNMTWWISCVRLSQKKAGLLTRLSNKHIPAATQQLCAHMEKTF